MERNRKVTVIGQERFAVQVPSGYYRYLSLANIGSGSKMIENNHSIYERRLLSHCSRGHRSLKAYSLPPDGVDTPGRVHTISFWVYPLYWRSQTTILEAFFILLMVSVKLDSDPTVRHQTHAALPPTEFQGGTRSPHMYPFVTEDGSIYADHSITFLQVSTIRSPRPRDRRTCPYGMVYHRETPLTALLIATRATATPGIRQG